MAKWQMKDGQPTFTQIETAILETEILSGSEKLFYSVLKSHRYRQSKQCNPSIRQVCNQAGMSKDSAYPAREKLKTLGIIDWTSVQGRNKSCHYRFILEDGNSEEISTALSNLKRNKIGGNKDSKNRRNKGQHLGGNKDSLYNNQMFLPDEKNTQKKAVCASSPDEKNIPADILQNINSVIEHMKDNGGFKTSEAAFTAYAMKEAQQGRWIVKDVPRPSWDWEMKPAPAVKGVPMSDNLKKKSGYGGGGPIAELMAINEKAGYGRKKKPAEKPADDEGTPTTAVEWDASLN